jgi:hypothetical protein
MYNRCGMGGNDRGNNDLFAKTKFKIPVFSSSTNPEVYLDWELVVEQKFNSHPIHEELSGIKIPGYPIDGKIQHPAQSLKPHRRGPSKVDSPKAQIACRSLVARTTNSIPPEPCGEVSGKTSASDGIFPPR